MSVAEEVKEWVENRPYVQSSLAEEIVNYSALARNIQEDVEGSHEAIKMALRRLSKQLKEERKTRKTNIGKVMKGTSVKLENNLQICKSKRQTKGIVVAETQHGFTAVQKSGKECRGEVIEDQVMISLESPENLENTPGVLSYILSILASQDINITELISCREDTHLIIDEEDATQTFELLNRKLK